MSRALPRAAVALVPALLLALAWSLGPVPTPAGEADKKDEEKKEEKWDVNNPPGEWSTITIDTDESTWTNVDVSPDGKTLVFDLLGDLYTVPITGGEAKALTES